MKKALITGITGQDGSYLAEFLLSKGYEVHGIIRRSSSFNTKRIEHLYQDSHLPGTRLLLHYGDLSDEGQITDLIYNIRPEEIYNLGAQSHVKVSFDMPKYTGDVDALGTTRLLEAIRRSGIKTRFYQASSSEMFGSAPAPQDETTPFHPRSPYACAKVYSYHMTINYREAYGLFACNGILFNHESPRRGSTFATRKITRGLARIRAGLDKKIYLGNLESKRDWGFAPEYVEAMWMMMQHDRPDDYVLGTGETHSLKELLENAFGYVNEDWKKYVEIDARYFRPTEVENLRANSAKAKKTFGWSPKIKFPELIQIMVDYDFLFLGMEPPGKGFELLKQQNLAWTDHTLLNEDHR
ncbi:MAG: GDP-mannose 4,6-dehydratase [Candidatus Omnitrophica bacterium]|nr:GDP-mannose 4,6-dehydratase [Candidatus Omnitrophota bacterium]